MSNKGFLQRVTIELETSYKQPVKSYASTKVNPIEVFISGILIKFYKIVPRGFNRHF